MQIRCPFCHYRIVIKGARAGGYHPPCPRCEKQFPMIVAMVEGHRLVLVGQSMETLAPVKSPKPMHELVQSPQDDAADEAEHYREMEQLREAGHTVGAATSSAIEGDDMPTAPQQPGRGGDPNGDDAATVATAGAGADQSGESGKSDDDDISAAIAAELDEADHRPRAQTDDDEATFAGAAPQADQTQTRPGAAAPQPQDDEATQARSARPASPAQPASPKPAAHDAPSAPTQDRAAPPPQPASGEALTGRLNGYEIEQLLGEGGMGSVYLARQLSLDRDVALKTIKPEWASNPMFLSRFTREAYAAAQLTHHNVVQIYDIGEDRETHFFSMEYVHGESLSQMLRRHGAMDVEQAAGYILQAARGLKFAHDHEMVHRDIKPGNLLVNDQGVVKVADLGLVKTAGHRDETITHQAQGGTSKRADQFATEHAAMGTPAYMAPEQSQDAAEVDGRADIYALGCTFYAMTTGRPLFEGSTAAELITKHTNEPVVPPERIAERVPKSISAIIMKMVAKKPDDRYANADELIAALEEFLGISAGPFTPREEHARALEDAVHAFNDSTRARLRRWLTIGFSAACLALFLFGALMAQPTHAAGAATLWAFTGIGYAIITGITQRTFLFRKLRQLVFGSRPHEWVAWGGVLLLSLALIVLLNLHWVVLVTAIIGVGLAAAVHFTIDQLVAAERRPHLDSMRDMLKSMRMRGLEEDAVRRFVCKYSGKHWEPFYEALFDYEAKMHARRLWGTDDDGKPRKKFGAWRDALIRWIDQKQEQREAEKQRKHLQKIELQRLKAEGKDDLEAARGARNAANAMVDRAAEYKHTGKWQRVDQADESAAPSPSRLKRRSTTAALADVLLGGRVRFVIGAVLLAVYALWVRQNELWTHVRDASGFDRLRDYLSGAESAEPLTLPGNFTLPAIANTLLFSHGVGLAGLLLLVAAFRMGKRATFMMIPAVVVLIGAPLALPHLPALPEAIMLTPRETALAAGALLGVIGLWLSR